MSNWQVAVLTAMFRFPALLLTLALWSPVLRADSLNLATLDWPPYVGHELAAQGASSTVIRAALLAEGNGQLKLEFMPWARALNEGTVAPRFHGYFPAYESEERNRQSLRSARIGESRIGFAYRRGEVMSWTRLDELADLPLGVVRGYVNTRELDQRIAAGKLKADAAVSDEANLRKLANGRVRLAVVDQAVFQSLISAKGPLAVYREQLVFDAQHLLEEKPLFIYFQRNTEGQRWLERFNRGLTKIDARAVFRQALEAP